MKKLFTICLLLSIATFAFSQDITFGARGGINFGSAGTLSGDVDPGSGVSKGSRTSINLGVYALKKLNDKGGVQVELYYSGEGYKLSGGGQTETNKINFINLPIFYKYSINENFYLMAGPQFGFKVGASTDPSTPGVDPSKYIKSLNLSLVPGVGYDINETMGISLRYGLGLSNIFSPPAGGSGTAKINTLSIVFNYKLGSK